jgi:anti-sigma-K factor RskA
MKMKQMPYRMEEGAIEQAKYRAKMAVREAAHPTERHADKVSWRWASAVAMVAVVVVGVIGFVKYLEESRKPLSPMEELIAEMQSAPDEIIAEWTADVVYYEESEVNSPM